MRITDRTSKCIPVLLSAVLGLTGALFADTDKTNHPNLIVIMTDDLGYADVGFNGCKDIPTPNIDSIAANGVKFTSGYPLSPRPARTSG